VNVKKKKNPNEALFLEMLEINKAQFYRIAFSYVKDEQYALDVIQESVYKAYTALDKMTSVKHMKTWFIRIVINQSIDQLRNNNKVIPLNQEEEVVDIHTKNLDAYEQMELREDMKKMLDQLNSTERIILMLRFYESYELKEIASILDKPISTVKSTLYRSLDKLKVLMEEGIING